MTPLAPNCFASKHALVTGGTRGIGAAISSALASLGAHVFLNFRDDQDSARRHQDKILSEGGRAVALQANLMRRDEVRQMFGLIADSGRLDMLVHAAALGSFKPTSQVRPNQWDLTLNTDPRGFLLCVQEALPLLKRQGGKVVAISSLGGRRVVPNYGAIGVAKAAQEALVRYLAAELAGNGIQVNGIAAGLVETDSLRKHPNYAELSRQAREKSPLARLASPEDVARVALFLCSPLSDWICGQTLVVDGGMSLGF